MRKPSFEAEIAPNSRAKPDNRKNSAVVAD
jgi:hypothetical protein